MAVTSTFTVDNRNQLTSGHTYDANGNMTYKGSDQLTYDAENQLVDYTIPGSYKTAFAYDGRGRLRQRTEYYSAGGTNWTFSVQITYLYDGMRVIQERNGTTPTVAYTRGHDLAGSLEGAGGIGGLLARTHGYSAGSWSTHHFYHADGNGNVTYLVNSSQGLGCSYRYRPYGELLSSSTGTLSAGANAYRFSSKEWMNTSGLYYYGYRFYQPTLQRWINRDPLGEEGGINLYAFVQNNPATRLDAWGLAPGDCYPTKNDAAKAAINDINPTSVKENREYGGNLYRKPNGKYTYDAPKAGNAMSVSIPKADKKYGRPAGDYHTHAAPRFSTDEQFSETDVNRTKKKGINSNTRDYDAYLGTPSGAVKRHNWRWPSKDEETIQPPTPLDKLPTIPTVECK